MKKLILSCAVVLTATCASAQLTWTTQNSAFADANTGINTISVVDATTAWGLGFDATGANDFQTFTRTANGGATWSAGSINLGDIDLTISDISAVSATTAYAIATYASGGAGGGVWKTTNSGATWAKQTTASFNLPLSFGNVVHFFDANNGFCQGDPTGTLFELYTTANGGTTWTKLTSASVDPAQTDEYGYVHNKAFAGDNAWFGTSKGRIYKTANKGATWTVVSTPITDFGSTLSSGTIALKDANNGWILASTGVVYKTVNGGTTWTAGTTLTQKTAITYVPGTTGTLIAVGSGTGATGSSISYNGGTTWTTIETANIYTSVSSFNASTVFSGGLNTNAAAGGVFKLTQSLATQENQTGNGIAIYPNPTADFLKINTDGKVKSVDVYDMAGRKMNILTEGNTVNVMSLESGTYIISIETTRGNLAEKFIKK